MTASRLLRRKKIGDILDRYRCALHSLKSFRIAGMAAPLVAQLFVMDIVLLTREINKMKKMLYRAVSIKTCFFMAVFCVAAVSAPVSVSFAETPAKWQSHVEAEGKFGTKRTLGEVGIFIPLSQNENTLFFTDLRGRFDDRESREGNFGLGLRHQVNPHWILGGYGYYDRRRTPRNNTFQQVTLGAEALSESLEARVNLYLPESGKKATGGAGGIQAGVGPGGQIQIQNFGAPVERALPGFDVEMGGGFDIGQGWQMWGYGGFFHFDASGFREVSGPRGRLEFGYDDLPWFGEESRLTLGVETQTDNVRGGQSFALARLRIPLASFGSGRENRPQLSGLDRRMTARITRDIDIVAGDGAAPLISSENATVSNPDETQTYGTVTTINANTADVPAAVTAAGANALVLFDGSAGQIDITNQINPAAGQFLVGGGAVLTATGDDTGTTANLTLSGSRPTIDRPTGDLFGISNNNVSLKSLDLTRGLTTVNIFSGATGIMIDDVNISNSAAGAISFRDGSAGSVQNSTITSPADNGIFLDGPGGNNVTVSDVTINTPGLAGLSSIGANTLVANDVTLNNTGTIGVFAASGSNFTLNGAVLSGTGSTSISTDNSTLSLTNVQIGDGPATGGVSFTSTTLTDGGGNTMPGSITAPPCTDGGGNTGSIAFGNFLGGGTTTNCP